METVLPIRFLNKEEVFKEARKNRNSLVVEVTWRYIDIIDYYLYVGDYDMDAIVTDYGEMINDGDIRKAYYHYFN